MSDTDGQHTPKASVAPIVAQVQADLQVWAARWPIFNPVRFPAVAHTTAVHLPDLSRDARALAALVSLWIIAFDEIVDEDRRTARQLAGLTERCRKLVACPAALDAFQADPVCASLQEIVRQMTGRSTFAAFAATWREAFLEMIDAIVEHRRLGNRKAPSAGTAATLPGLPAFAAVLALTTRSVGVRFYLVTSWILYEEPALVQRRTALLRSAEASAVAIRLANDLRTWRRDVEEGNVNTLTALERELATALPHLSGDHCRAQALALLREQLGVALDRTRAELQRSPLPGAAAERDMDRLVGFVTQLYARSDYHTYPAVPAAATLIQH